MLNKIMDKYPAPGGSPAEDDGSAGGEQMGEPKTVTVPADLMPGCKAGDTYTVKAMDGDNVTLEMAPGAGGEGGEENWGDALVKHVGGENA